MTDHCGFRMAPWFEPDRFRGAADVYEWRMPGEPDDACLAAFAPVLSDDERARIERFRFIEDKLRHAAGRHIVRTILSERVGISAIAVRFEFGAHGRPFVEGGPSFNIAHAGGVVAVVVARADFAGSVGVDVEKIASPHPGEVAESVFHPAELAYYKAAPPGPSRDLTFYSLWTGKEAALKATGAGLLDNPEAFNTLDGVSEGLDIASYRLDDGHMAAVAVKTD